MMAASKKMLDQEPSEIEMLLPFHAAGTLNARDARRVDEALASDPALGPAICRDPRGICRDHSSQREPRGAVRPRHAEAVRSDRRRARAQAIGVIQHLRAGLGIFRSTVAADAGLVGEPRCGRAAVAGRRDRHGVDDRSTHFVPDGLAGHERAAGVHHARFGRCDRRGRWCGLPTTRVLRISRRCSTAIRLRSSRAARAACSSCNSATARWAGTRSPR